MLLLTSFLIPGGRTGNYEGNTTPRAFKWYDIDGLVQDCSKSSPLAMEHCRFFLSHRFVVTIAYNAEKTQPDGNYEIYVWHLSIHIYSPITISHLYRSFTERQKTRQKSHFYATVQPSQMYPALCCEIHLVQTLHFQGWHSLSFENICFDDCVFVCAQ